jgi:hypothetical protein
MWLRFRAAALGLLIALGAAAGEQRRALIVVLDGVRRDTFAQTYAGGALPGFARILEPALWYDRAEAVIPTVTMSGQSSIFTGSPPARHGIPGNSWFDRAAGRAWDYTSSGTAPCLYAFTLFGAECRGGLLNRHILAPTLYEAAAAAGRSSLVAFHPVWRGATRVLLPSLVEGLALLEGAGLNYEAFDRKMAERAIEAAASGELPDILTLYFAGADGLAHSGGIAAQPPYLARVVDPLIGRLADALEARDPVWRDSTLVLVTADHGRTDAVANPEDRTLARDLEAAVLRAGFSSGQVYLAANGGMAHVYLRSGADWAEPPPAEALAAAVREIGADPVLAPAVATARPREVSDPARAGDLLVFLRAGHYFGNTGVGSHHGNADPLDLAVPLVVARPGAPGGHTDLPAGITQIAATVAEFLGFVLADGADPPLEIPPG